MTDPGTATTTANRRVVGGRYEYSPDQVLGSGGLAIVYRGQDLRARRAVAIKTLHDEFQGNPESRQRFRQEARTMAFTDHPHLVRIYDLIEQPSGSWIVMELVPGRNLKQIIEQEGPLPVAEAIRILDVVADALAHMHSRNVIHLDLKPQNIILTEDDSPKLIDFGLAQTIGPRQETVGGSAFGTAAYLSPEQGRGEAVDHRTDIYALGCVLYELLTGRPPFEAPEGPDQKQELIRLHIGAAPVPPSRVRPALPTWVDGVVLRALAKHPQQRYQTVRDFGDAALDGFDHELGDPFDRTEILPGPSTLPRLRLGWRKRPFGPTPAPALDEPDEPDERSPSLLRRAWMSGGRAARHSRPLRGTLWRFALVFAVGNLLLGSILLAREGPEALVERFLAVAPGTTTTVTVDNLNLRTGPGAGFEVLTVLPGGTEVEVTGLSETDAEGRWWPVRVELDDGTMSGWVWDGGLRSNVWTGRLSFVQDGIDRVQSVRRAIGDGVDTVRGWWPFS